MLSRRAFLAASLAAVASCANADDGVLLDLDFRDRDAADSHRRALDGVLRYVDHEVLDEAAGILIEDAAINGVEDAGYRSGGAAPAGWIMPDAFVSSKPCRATFTRAGDGRGQMRLQGDRAGEYGLTLGSATFFAVAKGDDLTGSLAIRLVSGDRAVLTGLGLSILQRDPAGTIVDKTPNVAPVQQIQTDRPWWAQVRTVATTKGHASLVLTVTTGAAFDLVLDIHTPQLEARRWRSSFCVGRREADSIALRAPQAYLGAKDRSVVITADTPRCVPAATLWREAANGGDAIEIVWRAHALHLVVTAAAVTTQMRLGEMPPLMRFSVCLLIGIGSVTASLNGKAPRSLPLAPVAVFTQAQLGQGRSGRWNAAVARLTVRTGRADPATESLRDVAFYDDFDRADSRSLGRSPSGQSIERVGAVETSIANKSWVAAGGLGLSFAAYGKVTLPTPPLYMGAVLSWSSGYGGGGAGLIAATNNLTPPTNALHTIVTDREEIFQTLTDSKVDAALASFVYPQPMPRDGIGRGGVARFVSIKDDAVVFVGPQGDLARHVSPTYVATLGPTAVFEHYWQAGQCRPQFHAVAAR